MPMVFKLNEVNNKISVGSDDRLHINKTNLFRCFFQEKRFGLIPFSSGFHVHCPVQVERTMYAPKRYHNQDGLIMLSSLPFTGFMCRFVHVVQCTTYTCSEFVLEVAGLCQQKRRFSSPIYCCCFCCCYYCCGCSHHNNMKLQLFCCFSHDDTIFMLCRVQFNFHNIVADKFRAS